MKAGAIQEMFAKAVGQHQSGRIDDAERIYRHILRADPDHADSLHLLGVVAYQRGQSESAVNLINGAIARNGHAAPYYSNLGNALKQAGRTEDAVACYRRAVELSSNFAEGHNNLGVTLQELGQLPEAIVAFSHAIEINPHYADAHFNLGTALVVSGRQEEAAACFVRATKIAPEFRDAHFHLGDTMRSLGHLDQAIACFRHILDLHVDHAETHNNLGSALAELGQLDDAVISFRKAIAFRHDYAEAHYNLATALQNLRRRDEAITSFHRAIELKTDYGDAHYNLGNVLHDDGRFEEAASAYRHALDSHPGNVDALSNLGNTLRSLNLLGEAGEWFRSVIDSHPDLAEAHWNYSQVLLQRGDFAEGWQEFEWRWQVKGAPPDIHATPRWDGKSLAGKTILLHAEQGLGDVLMFVRYATMMAALGGKVILETYKPLARLLASVPGVAQVVISGEPRPSFDCHLPMLSAPLVMGTNLATVPVTVPYVSPDAAATRVWAERLAGLEGLKVGLVWSGDPRPESPRDHAMDRRRSVGLSPMVPLLALPGVSFVSLQKGVPATQIGDIPQNLRPHDFMEEVNDFADTAALLANLDLVITVDTAVAHLAGAMARPVWIMSRFDGCWRWLSDRDDSPWYPTARLFRQNKPGAWGGVIDNVVEALATLKLQAVGR